MLIHLTLVPIGHPDPEALRLLAEDVAVAGFRPMLTDREEVPEPAYRPSRGQYRAEAFLKLLRKHAGERVLGVTDVDLYTARLNFVLGMAEGRGRVAVISLARLGANADREKARARAMKEAVHEIGHTFGLGHCADPDCVMHFSNSLSDTDRKSARFCERCRRRAGRPTESGNRP